MQSVIHERFHDVVTCPLFGHGVDVNIFGTKNDNEYITNSRDSDILKVSVYPKFDHFSIKLFFAFSDRSYYNLSL